jgi:Putative prokaryotic signal transducing protein
VSRVRIGTCLDPADATLVRSLLSAHGIAVVVGAEHHASLFGPMGASFLSLDIWVDEEDHDEAAALLQDLRERDERGDQADDDGADVDDDRTDDGEPDDRDPSSDSVQRRIDRRRRTGAVLLLGACITFGTAHMFTGAWMRGLMLAAIEILGLRQLGDDHARHLVGGIAVAAAILTDLIGALWRVRAASRPDLPAARVHNA